MPDGGLKERCPLAPALGTFLAPTLRDLPLGIAGSTAAQVLARAADDLPPVSAVLFETRLLANDGAVDLSLRHMPEDGSDGCLVEAAPAHFATDPLWQRTQRLGRLLWGHQVTVLRPFIDRLWVEIDNADLAGAMPRPSLLFVDVLQAAIRSADSLARVMSEIVLPLALERALPEAEAKTIAGAIAALRPMGDLNFIGACLNRADRAVRLVFRIKLPLLRDALEAAGLGPRAAEIAATVAMFGHGLETVAVQLDATDTIGSRVGIEFRDSPSEDWRAKLRLLVAHGLASEARSDALLEWPSVAPALAWLGRAGCTIRIPRNDPARLARALAIRRLNHVKLDFTPDDALAAKAYLFAGFLWPLC